MTDEDRIATLARALCTGDGRDPDAPVKVTAAGTRETTVPAWTRYVEQARRITATMEALGPGQTTPSPPAEPASPRAVTTREPGGG